MQAIVIVQGLASALPWNVYVTESEFFTLRVHVPPFHRVLADNFENAQLLTSQAACAVSYFPFKQRAHPLTLAGLPHSYPSCLQHNAWQPACSSCTSPSPASC